MNKYDLRLLENLAEDSSGDLLIVSPETVYLCLMALDDRAIFQGAWLDDDQKISDARWDIADAAINKARAEIMGEITLIDGGQAESISIFCLDGGASATATGVVDGGEA